MKNTSISPIVDRKKVEQDWESRGFRAGLWVDPPGQVWKDYVHSVDELVMPVEGELEIEMNGKRYRIRPGEELLIPAHTLHTVRNLTDRASRWLYAYKSR